MDADFLAVGRAAARARLALARQERAEPDHGDAVALGHARHDRVEHGVDGLARGGLAQVSGARRGMNEIGLRHYGWHALSPSRRASIISASNREYNRRGKFFCARENFFRIDGFSGWTD